MKTSSTAAGDLLGSDGEAPPEADVLLLEQATVYLALNLLAEAARQSDPGHRPLSAQQPTL